MKRLHEINLNTPQTHIVKEPDWFDIKRLDLLNKYYDGGNWLDLGAEKDETVKLLEGYKICVRWVELPLPNSTEQYTYVTAGQLLEHFECPKLLIAEIFRILEPGGIFALSVPYKETEKGEIDMKYHIWSFDEKDIKTLLQPYCKKIKIKIIGSQFFPKYKYHFPHILAYGWKKNEDITSDIHTPDWRWLTRGLQRRPMVQTPNTTIQELLLKEFI